MKTSQTSNFDFVAVGIITVTLVSVLGMVAGVFIAFTFGQRYGMGIFAGSFLFLALGAWALVIIANCLQDSGK